MKQKLPLLFMLIALMAFVAAGCGGDDEEGGGGNGGTAGTGETGVTENAQQIDVSAMENATGDVTYCTGKDTSGGQTAALEIFNEQNPDLNARLLEFPESADEQRNQFIQRQRAESSECDVFYADVIWTAEFAAQNWIYDMTPYLETRRDEFIPSTIETVTYDGKLFGVPQQTDAGFLYYRTDQVDQVPETWQGVYESAEQNDGIVYQGAPYEGLTVDFLELGFAAGGQVLNEDGTESVFNSPENVRALQFMVDGIQNGAAPRAVVTYKEEEARRAFEAGRATWMRNWPYAYALAKKSDIADDFEVVPYPPFEGGGRAGILGGHNLVVSRFSQNPGGALKLVDFLTKPEAQKLQAAEYSLAPVLTQVYDDPEVKEALPFSEELLQAVQQAKSRPVSPVYTQISQAIYENVNAALAGNKSPEQAIQDADAGINRALETF